MIVCPNCQSRELAGALFCGECGASLLGKIGANEEPSGAAADLISGLDGRANAAGLQLGSSVGLGVALNLLNNDQILMLGERSEVTLGRVSEGQPVKPDIDLTPYRGYEQGVSRLHAAIRIQNGQVVVIDLGSANGTRVNGKKIFPHAPHLLKHGDVLTLGKFKVEVLVQT